MSLALHLWVRHCVLEKVLCYSLFSFCRSLGFSEIVLERWCNKCIIFKSINRSYLFRGWGQRSLVFSQCTSENRVDCLNVEDSVLSLLVCKTLYKWVLINFCFNTWSYHRLSGAVNLQGVSWPKLCPVSAMKRGAITAGHVGLGSSVEGTSAQWTLLLSLHKVLCQLLFLCLSALYKQKDAWELWPLVLWAGWLYSIGLRQVCVCSFFLPTADYGQQWG